MPDIERKIKVPPRRRSAVLSVDLEDGRTVKAAVNATSVAVSVPARSYPANVQKVTLPRNVDDLDAIVKLIEAAIDEVNDQDEFAAADRAAVEGVAG